MPDARVVDLEVFKASKMAPARFHTVAQVERRVRIDITGEFTPAAARLLAKHITERADAAEREQA